MINRDGSTVSLWQNNAKPYIAQEFSFYNTYEAIIVGGGITGLATALKLQEMGMNCLILEAKNLCFGTTAGTTAHLNTLLDTPYNIIEKNFDKERAAAVAKAAKLALELVKRNIETYHIECAHEPADAYLFSQDNKEDQELQDVFDASVRAGLSPEFVQTIPFPVSYTRACKVAGQAKFNPIDYVYGVAKAFESIGGHILQDCRVTGSKGPDIVEVETSKGIFKSKKLIYATHIPPGVNLLHLRCSPYRTYAMAVRLEDGNYPKGLAYDMLDPYNYYRSHNINGVDYLIAGGKDHKTGDIDNTAYLFTKLEATIRENFQVTDIVHKWSSQYFESTDGLPYIGRLPGQPGNVFVATGFGGNGMTYSHVTASLLADIFLRNKTDLEDIFSPSRIKPVAGFSNFVTHNVATVGNFLGKLFSADKIDELADLSSGEGKIVDYQGDKLGLYKDEKGSLHAVNTVCSHLKCEVKWNTAELSWDCPCHGARFNCEGEVLTGPADHPLERVNIEDKK